MCSKTNCAICLGNVHNGPYEMSPNFFKQLKISGKHKKKTWPEKLKCGHVFHLKCIKDWFMGERDSSEKCPMCRHKIKFSNKFGSTSRKIYKEKTVKYAKKEELDYESDNSDDVYLGGGMWMDDVMPPLIPAVSAYTIANIFDGSGPYLSSQGTQTEDSHITNEINDLYTVENVDNLEPRRLNFDDISVVSDASSADEDALLFEENDTIKVLPPLFTWNKRTQKKTTKFTHNKRYFARMNVHTCKKWKKY